MKDKKQYNIGLTGSSGFIGSAILNHFKNNDDNVIILDSLVEPNTEKSEVLIPDTLDWILHFGATKSIETSFENPIKIYRRNMHSTMAALDVALSKNSRFLYMSSYVYGQPHYLPVDEEHPIAVLNPYMGSKIAGEQVCRHLSNMLKIPLVILRGFNIYGDCRTPGRLISDLLESAAIGKPIVLNDPVPRRDYLFIKDFEKLILKIISQNPVQTGTFNVGYGQSYSNLEVAEMVKVLSGNKLKIIIKSNPRPQDILDCTADVSLVKRTFSWTPRYSLKKGLMELLQ